MIGSRQEVYVKRHFSGQLPAPIGVVSKRAQMRHPEVLR